MPLLTITYNFLFSPGYYLLDNAVTRAITKYMSPEYLLDGAQILVVMIALVVSAIYLYLFYKKRNFFYTERIRKNLEPMISHIIMEETIDSLEMPKKMNRILSTKVARQYAIDELIRCKKNFSGLVAEQVVGLYIQLGLKKDTLQKVADKRKWHVKAKGIQELYMMDQKEALVTIYRNTNSTNEFVRMEAQTGVIHLTGFPGLRFLDVISYPLTEWQQLKLLEQLRLHPEKADISEKLPNWLQSKNETVVVFALKLADEYQFFGVRHHVISCLVHASKSVRSQALKTLIRLEDESTPGILLGYFKKESLVNQFLILDALRTMATEKEAVILEKILDHENDTVKLKAAIVLAACSENGLAILERKAAEQPEPYQRIYRHVKTVK